MVSLFLTNGQSGNNNGQVSQLTNYRDVRKHGDFEKYITFQRQMQRSGVYFHPNMFESMFLSTAHTSRDIELVLERMESGARCCLVK